MQPPHSSVGGVLPGAEGDVVETVGGVRVVHWNPLRANESGDRVPLNNFGDLLGPVILSALSAELPVVSADVPRLLSAGSIMHFAADGDVVWGTGVNGKIALSRLTAKRLDVRAVRGPRTRAILRSLGHSVPPIYGDPALLLPILFPEIMELSACKKRAVTVVPNINDLAGELAADERVVSPRAELNHILRQIAQSEFVIGSSLHAIIVAESLGIPARLFASKYESHLKYADYYAGTGRTRIAIADDLEEAIALGGAPRPDFDAAALLNSFPKDMWTGYSAPSEITVDEIETIRLSTFVDDSRELVDTAWELREFTDATDADLAVNFVGEVADRLLESALLLDPPRLAEAVDAASDYLSLLPDDVRATVPFAETWAAHDLPAIARLAMLRKRGVRNEIVRVQQSDSEIVLEGLQIRESPSDFSDTVQARFVDAAGQKLEHFATTTRLAPDGSTIGWTMTLNEAMLAKLASSEWTLMVDAANTAVAARILPGISADRGVGSSPSAVIFGRTSLGTLFIGASKEQVVGL